MKATPILADLCLGFILHCWLPTPRRLRNHRSEIKSQGTRNASRATANGKSERPPERKRLQKTINRLQDELIEVQQTVTSLKEMRIAPSNELAIDLSDVLALPPTEEEIAAAISALTAGGADVEKDAEGKVVYVKATEVPLDDDTVAQMENFVHVKRISVSGPWVTLKMFDTFGKLKTLEQLDCEVTIANTEAMKKLVGLPKLKFLQLFRTDIDDDSMAVLAKMPALQQIRCGQTRIGDAGLQHLSKLKTLKAIDLSDCNRVSGVGCQSTFRTAFFEVRQSLGPANRQ